MTTEQKDFSLGSKMQFNEKEVEFKCEQHGLQKVKVFHFSGKWTNPYCRKCEAIKKEKEELEEKAREKRRQEIARQERVKAALGRAMIPERFKHHTFESFFVENDTQKTVKKRCQNYAKDFTKMNELGTSMIFCGTTGTGKTHLACAIANDIIRQGNAAVFISVLRAIRRVKETYDRDNKTTEQEAINWFLNPDLLILDEVGVQFGTDSEKMILFEIINERYQNMKPTILISNLSPQAIKDYVGARVMDRMKENDGRVLQFDWKSKRGAK